MVDKIREFNPLFFEPDYDGNDVIELPDPEDYNDSESKVSCESEQIACEEDKKDELLIDLSEEINELDYALEINGISTFPKGDLQAIKAKAKQGKTHTILCIMTALLSGEFLTIKSKIKEPKICYFATEEHLRSLHMLAKKVHRLCSWEINKNNDSFKVYTLRRQSPEERVEYIDEKIEEEKPDVVFIDGIRDLLYDFNNIEQSNKIVTSLLQIAEEYHTAIVNVLHTNKGAMDSNMRGHLGTELLNKCSDVLEVAKKKEVFVVTETDSRNIETGYWAFQIDVDGLPVESNYKREIELKEEERIKKMSEDFSKVLADGKQMRFTDLKNAYMQISKFKESAAMKHITEAKGKGIIKQNSNKRYELCK